MHREAGMTMVELLTALLFASLVIAFLAVYAVPEMMGRETVRSSLSDLQVYTQLARMEAVNRNRECRFLLNPDLRRVLVVDTMGTATSSDDLVLHETTLSSVVEFKNPGGGSPVTLKNIGGSPTWFETLFGSDGTVSDGAGAVMVRGGDRYKRLSVFAAGGTEVATWTGLTWSTTRF